MLSIWRKKALSIATLAGGIAAAAAGQSVTGAVAWVDDHRTLADFIYAQRLVVPPQDRVKTFYPRDRQANFTYFDGVGDVQVQDGELHFTVVKNPAVLGWGNYLNLQPRAEIVDMWTRENNVALRVRQSGASNSAWSVKCWSDGARMTVHNWFAPTRVFQQTLTGNDWAELRFKPWRRGRNNATPPDGMELEIQAAPGTHVSLAWIKLVQEELELYARKEFVLPDDTAVWRALAEVAAANGEYNHCFVHATELYVNGRAIAIPPAYQRTDLATVDLKPYLRAGTNCVALHGRGDSTICNVFLQGTIMLDSGASMPINTDASWKVSPRPAPGWQSAGFDDAAWSNAAVAGLSGTSMERAVREGKGYGLAAFPAQQGCLAIKNPHQRELFYAQDRPVQIQALFPPGCASSSPKLEYVIEKVDRSGACSGLANGRLDDCRAAAGAPGFALDCGLMPPGVYALSLRLTASGGAVLGSVIREPFVVIRNQQPVMDGKNYRDGLELELEDQIDFTNPADPHPWIEAAGGTANRIPDEINSPRIVRQDELAYREGARGAASTITYRLPPLKHPGDFYLLEMEYPDNADRETEISVETIVNGRAVYMSSAGAASGGRYYRTGVRQVIRWLQVAEPGVQLFQIANAAPENLGMQGAAACALKVYHIRNALPAVAPAAGGRTFGVQMERSEIGGAGYAWTFGLELPQALAATNFNRAIPWQGYLAEAVAMYESAARLAQYLKFAGQNVHCIGCYQYDPFNTPMARAFAYDTARILPCTRNYLANVLDANRIGFYANVEFLQHYFDTFASDAQVARGADTARFVDASGRQQGNLRNWLHPEVRQGFLALMRDLAGRFGALPHFQGVNLFLGGHDLFWGFGPTDYQAGVSVDDAAFLQFKKDMQMDDLIDDQAPDRFKKRANLLNNPAFARRYDAWRSRQGHALLADACAELRKVKPGVQVLCPMLSWMSYWKYYLEQELPLPGFMQKFAVNPELYQPDTGVRLGPVLIGWSCYEEQGDLPAHRLPYHWMAAQDESVIGVFRGARENLAFVLLTNHEGATLTPKSKWEWVGRLVKSDWIVNTHKSWKNSQPAGFSVRENFANAMIGLDPASLLFGFADGGYPLGFDQPLRKFGMMFTRLPRAPFQTVLHTGAATNLVIRQLAQSGTNWFYLVNPGYWYADAEIQYAGGDLECVVPWQKFEVAGKDGLQRLTLRLEPFDLVAFKTPGALAIKNFSIGGVSEREIAHMTGMADAIEVLLRNAQTRTAVTAAERVYLQKTMAAARQALTARHYALAWSQLGDWRVWVLWKMHLEPAARAAAALPPDAGCESKTLRSGLPVITAARTPQPPVLDGKPDDPCWRARPFSTGFVGAGGQAALAETGVKALYDDRNLYLAFICAEREPGAVKAAAQDESHLFHSGDDVISIFLQPDEQVLLYYQLAFNAKGVRFDQRVVGRIADFPREFYDFTADWQAAGAIDKTCWTAEAVIPFAALDPPGSGAKNWRINFHRILRDKLSEPAAWAQTGNFHAPNAAGRLEFAR